MSRMVIVILGTLLSAAAAAGLAGQTHAPLIVAYMTSDGELVPIASVVAFSTAEGKLSRYTPIGILRLGMGSIWAMSEWGIESQTIVLFELAGKGVRKLTLADVSGC